eukprot:16441212-Heterocapsa_arctica.AAC.1
MPSVAAMNEPEPGPPPGSAARSRTPGRGSKGHSGKSRLSSTSHLTGKGRHDEARPGSWLDGIPFAKSEMCRNPDDCTHRYSRKGCSFAHSQREVDE